MATDSPFAVLGLAPSFALTRQDIERAYLLRAAALHPDRGGHADSGAEADSARLNEARSALLAEESRAAALLALLGGPDAAACPDLPPGFLAEMLQARVDLEEATASGDAAELDRWRAWAAARRVEVLARVAGLFAGAAGVGPGPSSARRSIRVELNALRYLERMLEQMPRSGGVAP